MKRGYSKTVDVDAANKSLAALQQNPIDQSEHLCYNDTAVAITAFALRPAIHGRMPLIGIPNAP